MGAACDCGHHCDCKCGCNATQSCQCGPGCKCDCPCASKDVPMSPDRLASKLRAIADGIDRAENPDRRKVYAAVRNVLTSVTGRFHVRRAAVQTPGIMAKKPQIDEEVLALVLDKLEVDDTRVGELVAVEDFVAQAVFDATSTLCEALADLETEYGYGFEWTEGGEEPPEPDEAPALGEAPEPSLPPPADGDEEEEA
jgi:hypothetical protein